MISISEIIGVPEGKEFKFGNTKNVEIINSVFKVENNKLLIKRDRDKTFGDANVDVNKLMTLKVVKLPDSLLTDKERAYLKAVIEPIKDKVKCIRKLSDGAEYISICYYGEIGGYFHLYEFVKGTQFKGMESGENYTLKELGLED